MNERVDAQREAFEKVYGAGDEHLAFHDSTDPLMRYVRDRRLSVALRRLVRSCPAGWRDWSALVVCGGVGGEGTFLHNVGFAPVTVSDVSPAAIEACGRRDPRLVGKVMDAESLDAPDGSYDLVLVQDGLHHLSRPVTGLTEMLRVARRAVSRHRALRRPGPEATQRGVGAERGRDDVCLSVAEALLPGGSLLVPGCAAGGHGGRSALGSECLRSRLLGAPWPRAARKDRSLRPRTRPFAHLTGSATPWWASSSCDPDGPRVPAPLRQASGEGEQCSLEAGRRDARPGDAQGVGDRGEPEVGRLGPVTVGRKRRSRSRQGDAAGVAAYCSGRRWGTRPLPCDRVAPCGGWSSGRRWARVARPWSRS